MFWSLHSSLWSSLAIASSLQSSQEQLKWFHQTVPPSSTSRVARNCQSFFISSCCLYCLQRPYHHLILILWLLLCFPLIKCKPHTMPDTEERFNNYLLNKQKYRNLNKRKQTYYFNRKITPFSWTDTVSIWIYSYMTLYWVTRSPLNL